MINYNGHLVDLLPFLAENDISSPVNLEDICQGANSTSERPQDLEALKSEAS